MRGPSPRLLLAAWCCAGAVYAASASAQAPKLAQSTQAIVDGELSAEQAVVALLTIDRRLGCTGIFVRPHVVLTAAHCVSEGTAEPTSVFIGGDLSVSGKALPVVKRLVHPEFTSDSLYADIALLGVEGEVELEVASLARDAPTQGFANLTVDVLGFGCTDLADETSGIGQRRSARDTLTGATEDDKLRHGPVTCRGDSGGPLLGSEGALKGLVVGVTSSGGDKDGSAFSLATSVSAFGAWADQRADELDAELTPESSSTTGCSAAPATRFDVFGPHWLLLLLMCHRRHARLCRATTISVAAAPGDGPCVNPR